MFHSPPIIFSSIFYFAFFPCQFSWLRTCILATGSLEELFLRALDMTDRARMRKNHGLNALPDRHVGCRVTAEIRNVSQSADSEDKRMTTAGTPFQLQIFGFHHCDCAGILRSVQHFDPELRTWCMSLMRLRMNHNGVRDAIDEFLRDRVGFASTFASSSFCIFYSAVFN